MSQAKIKHIWSVLCASSVTDQETNQMSLHNLVDQLNIESLPKVASKKLPTNKIPAEVDIANVALEVVSFFQRSDDWKNEDFPLNVAMELIDPKGEILNTGNFVIVFPKGFKRMRYRTKMQGFKITSPGEYLLRLRMEDGGKLKEVASLPLDVKFQVKLD